jgi:uncharacterized membrane-anchored protein
MNLERSFKFAGAIALQLIILAALMFFKLIILAGGTEVALRIAPVDPRDPLRGDYVVLNYDISTANRFNNNETFLPGEEVYVPLYESGKYWSAGGIMKKAPEGGVVFIKGRIVSGSGNTYRLNYGI